MAEREEGGNPLHGVEVWSLLDIAQIDDSKIFNSVRDLGQNIILSQTVHD